MACPLLIHLGPFDVFAPFLEETEIKSSPGPPKESTTPRLRLPNTSVENSLSSRNLHFLLNSLKTLLLASVFSAFQRILKLHSSE